MRRSQAPSMRQAAKRGIIPAALECSKRPCTEPLDMPWGTTGGYKNKGPRRYRDDEDPLKNKRIFLVLWRIQSNKKHKTWTGNGTLEMTATQVTLKNEIGKVLDVLTCFKHEKIHEGALLEIGMKDVEIQMELKTKAECLAQRKEEIENWYQLQEEASGIISAQDNIPNKSHRSINPLKIPKHSLITETHTTPPKIFPRSPYKINEYICMLTPADLQMQTMQLLAESYQTSSKETANFFLIAQQICDHPVLLKHFVNEPLVSDILMPNLPPWQEMGLYDSAKFEFVHQMLDNWVVGIGKKCAIVASSQSCLDIIKGYCQCWDIPHHQLDDNNTPTIPEDETTPMVFLLLASKLPVIRLTSCKYLILYNYNARSAGIGILAGDCDTQIYTLITADCLEERQFQQYLGLVESVGNFDELLKVPATHKLVSENKTNVLADWTQWQPPFSEVFLKEAFKCDELSSLSFVFSNQQTIS